MRLFDWRENENSFLIDRQLIMSFETLRTQLYDYFCGNETVLKTIFIKFCIFISEKKFHVLCDWVVLWTDERLGSFFNSLTCPSMHNFTLITALFRFQSTSIFGIFELLCILLDFLPLRPHKYDY